MEAATREGSPFSPARFAGFLEKREDVWKQFFRGESGEQLGGLIKLMRHIERAGQFAENPPTGNRLLQVLFFGGSVASPDLGAAAVTSSLGLKGLFQTTTGRNMLLAANTATEGSAKMDNVAEQIVKLLSRSTNQQDTGGT